MAVQGDYNSQALNEVKPIRLLCVLNGKKVCQFTSFAFFGETFHNIGVCFLDGHGSFGQVLLLDLINKTGFHMIATIAAVAGKTFSNRCHHMETTLQRS